MSPNLWDHLYSIGITFMNNLVAFYSAQLLAACCATAEVRLDCDATYIHMLLHIVVSNYRDTGDLNPTTNGRIIADTSVIRLRWRSSR